MQRSIYCLLLFLILANPVYTQIESFRLGVGSSLVSRILILDESFSEQEKQAIKDIEIPRLAPSISLGLTTTFNDKNSLELGVSYKWLQFGTKKYSLPDSIQNTTPQTLVHRQFISQNQIFILSNYVYTPNRLKNSNSFFFGAGIVYNYNNYHIRSVDFDAKDNRSFIGKAGGESIKFHELDVHLSAGANLLLFSWKNRAIWCQPFLGGYVRQYDVFAQGDIVGYLPFKKNTNGLLWEFGTKIIYTFNIGE